jgi:hypothetical protein
MSVLSQPAKPATDVTSGEVLVGTAWLAVYAVLIVAALTRAPAELLAALDQSGLW